MSTLVLTVIALLAFAGNSLLCRTALATTAIDPASFTLVRLASGALMLWLLVRFARARPANQNVSGNWGSAAALFAYAIFFAVAYRQLTAATGALLLFGGVQATMITAGYRSGERLRRLQSVGVLLALCGLVALLLPGWAAPPLSAAALMLGAGVAWGVYSLRGKGIPDPLRATSDNFLRSLPLILIVWIAWLAFHGFEAPSMTGIALATLSGAVTSGIGYAIWYTALRGLTASTAATVQLAVPVITAIGGSLMLHEALSLRLVLASAAILGGIALVILFRHR